MKLVICILILLQIVATISAQTYYVSKAGSNSGTGTKNNPFKKISQVPFASGITVKLRRGDTFREMVEGGPGTSNAYRNDITFEDYGNANKDNPVIAGSLVIKGWTKIKKNVWESEQISLPGGGRCFQCGNNAACEEDEQGIVDLFINGKRQTIAREPNVGKHYRITSSNSLSHFRSKDAAGNGNNNYNGAHVKVRTFSWTHQHGLVGDSDNNGNIDLTGSFVNQGTGSTLLPDWGFYFDGLRKFLDYEGEWHYDPNTRRIRLYSSSNPGNKLVEGTYSGYGHGICLFWSHGHRIKNIDFKHQAESAITPWLVEDVKVINCHQTGGYRWGMTIPWGDSSREGNPINIEVRDSSFSNNLDGGFRSNAPSNGNWGSTEVHDCVIKNNGLVWGYGVPLYNEYHNIAVRFNGGATDFLFRKNKVIGCGKTCLAMEGPSRAQDNFLSSACLTHNDCSVIVQNHAGIKIIGNIIKSAVGYMDNAGQHSSGSQLPHFVWGIRSHLGNGGAIIRGNTFAFNQAEGILVESTTGHTIEDNLFFMNGNPARGSRQIHLQNAGSTTLHDNIFLSYETGVRAGVRADPRTGLSISRNRYCHPFEKQVWASGTSSWNLNQWKNVGEGNAKGCPNNIPDLVKDTAGLKKKVALLCNKSPSSKKMSLGDAKVKFMDGSNQKGGKVKLGAFKCVAMFRLNNKDIPGIESPAVITVASKPRSVEIDKVDNDSARIKFKKPTDDGQTTILEYQIQYWRTNQDVSNASTKKLVSPTYVDPKTVLKKTLNGLRSDTRYNVRIRAKNEVGYGAWTGTKNFRTD